MIWNIVSFFQLEKIYVPLSRKIDIMAASSRVIHEVTLSLKYQCIRFDSRMIWMSSTLMLFLSFRISIYTNYFKNLTRIFFVPISSDFSNRNKDGVFFTLKSEQKSIKFQVDFCKLQNFFRFQVLLRFSLSLRYKMDLSNQFNT